MKLVKNILMKKISKISKKNNKYILLLSDNSSLSFYGEVIIKYNLLKPRSISDNELKEMSYYNTYLEAVDKALVYISKKLRTKKEIIEKLKDYDPNIINKVISKLELNGYLNDTLYVTSYVNDQINLKTSGPKKIKRELLLKGFSEKKIDDYLSKIEDNIWKEKIKKIINKKINSNRSCSKNLLVKKIKIDLINLGYEIDLINRELEFVNIEESDEVLSKEFHKLLKRYTKKYTERELKNKIKFNLYNKGFSLDKINKLIDKM